MSYQTIDQLRRLANRVLAVRKTRSALGGGTMRDLALVAAHRRDQIVRKLNRYHPEWKRHVLARIELQEDRQGHKFKAYHRPVVFPPDWVQIQ